ncbi:hypothetical protein [Arhodomonas sp. KWT]|nr:hypothetical protein [Arhodomonas sp. KWT]
MKCLFVLLVAGMASGVWGQSIDKKKDYQEFQCGDARVFVEGWGRFENARALVTVSNRGRDTKLWLHSVDFIGGECWMDSSNRREIVIQAYCGGSGCGKKSFGIIEPDTLRISLVPVISAGGRQNVDAAEEILGKDIEGVSEVINWANIRE